MKGLVPRAFVEMLDEEHDVTRHLHAFIQTQVRYYKQCGDVMEQLQRELAK